MLENIRHAVMGKPFDESELKHAMEPAYDAISDTVRAGKKFRTGALAAVDFAINHLEIAKSLQDSTTPQGHQTVKDLQDHITALSRAEVKLYKAKLHTSSESSALAERVKNALEAAAAFTPDSTTEIQLKAQNVVILERVFSGHIKELATDIDRLTIDRFPKIPLPYFRIRMKLHYLIHTISSLVTRVIHFFKPINMASINGLREYAESHESEVRYRLKQMNAMGIDPDEVLPLLPRRRHIDSKDHTTFGTVLRNARNHVGPTAATFLHAAIHSRLPEKYKHVADDLSVALDYLAAIVDASPFATLDDIINQKKDPHFGALMKSLIPLAEKVLDTWPIDEDVAPQVQRTIISLIKNRLTAEVSKLRELPDNLSLEALLAHHDTPLIRVSTAELIKSVNKAREWKAKLNSKEIKSLPSNAPFFTKLAIDVLPHLRYWLASEWVAHYALKGLTSLPTRFLVSKLGVTKLLIKLCGGDRLTKDQQDAIASGAMALLKVLSHLDITGSDNRPSLRCIVKVIDVLLAGIAQKEPLNTKEYAIQVTEALNGLTNLLGASTGALFAGIQAVGHLDIAPKV